MGDMVRGCDRCEKGFVPVTTAYVDRLAPRPAPLDADLAAEEGMVDAYDLLVARIEAQRVALANTMYPCKICQPAAFLRWADDHMDREPEEPLQPRERRDLM